LEKCKASLAPRREVAVKVWSVDQHNLKFKRMTTNNLDDQDCDFFLDISKNVVYLSKQTVSVK
jgi:hypothetical protein